MSIFDGTIHQATPLGEEPRGPGKCPTPGCEELESGWSQTGQCPKCVDEAHAEAERELIEATTGKWIVKSGDLKGMTREDRESLKEYLARTGKVAVVTAVRRQGRFKILEPKHDCPCGNRFYESITNCPACGRPQWSES